MAARAYWSGYIRVSLLQVAVELYTATASGKSVTLHKIHEPSGKRVRYQNVVEDIGPIDRDEIIRGYEYSKGKYVTLEEEEIDALKLESKKTIDIIQFVDSGEIDAIYYDTPYYLVPRDAMAEDGYRTIRDAMRETKKLGIGQLVIGGRERLVALKPCGNGILVETLRYADQVRKASAFFKEIDASKVEKDQVELAAELIKRKTAKFDPSRFEDHYRSALKELIDAKVEGRAPEEPSVSEKQHAEMTDIMAALKKSLGQEEAKKPAAKKKPAAGSKSGGAKKTASKGKKKAA